MHDKCSPAILPHVLLRLRTDDRLQVRAEAVPGLKFGVQERTAVNIFQSKVVARDQVEKPFTQLISWETFGWVDGADVMIQRVDLDDEVRNLRGCTALLKESGHFHGAQFVKLHVRVAGHVNFNRLE